VIAKELSAPYLPGERKGMVKIKRVRHEGPALARRQAARGVPRRAARALTRGRPGSGETRSSGVRAAATFVQIPNAWGASLVRSGRREKTMAFFV
jgi:hypothetical protein